MTPKEVIELAQEARRQVRRPQVHRFPGHVAAHDHPGAAPRRGRSSRTASAFDGSSIRGWQPINASDMIMIPDPDDGADRPVLRAPDAQPHLLDLRPDHEAALLARPAPHREEGRGVPQARRGIGDTAFMGPEAEFFVFDDVRFDQSQPNAGLLLPRQRRGRVEQRPRGVPEPRLQDAAQGGLLPRPADRHARRPAPGDHDRRCMESGHRGRGRPPRGRDAAVSARSG